MKRSNKIIPLTIPHANAVERMELAVRLYSMSKFGTRYEKVVRDKMVTLIAIYLIHGISRKSRILAANIFNQKIKAVYRLSTKLVRIGFLDKKVGVLTPTMGKELELLREHMLDTENPMLLFTFSYTKTEQVNEHK